MFAGIYFAGAAFAGLVGLVPVPPLPPPETGVGISIGGVPVTARVRVQGVTIRDVLNDAPNTATLQIEGDAPAVGQSVRITMGGRVLFAGAVQTVDQAYESTPVHLIWGVTAIDDTGLANARRPFGTFVDVSATTIAQTITATYAPGFSTSGLAPGLPLVSIIFDGADPFIACLSRLATAVGGYCKVEDRVVYLFLEDTVDPPAPIDDGHRFLTSPPIQVNTDVSQLRTRVYGKGYGEHVTADLAAGETLLPIQNGVTFPPLGGTLIAGLTADGAQSEKLAYTGVVLATGGSLVGPGAAPANAPVLELQGGAGCDPGLHTVSVCYVTATGRSLAGPPASITTGTHPPPATAPTAGTATNGTGPDEGWHDYAVSFVTSYGETVAYPVSNAIQTSAAVGQLPIPGTPAAGAATAGAGLDNGTYDWATTYVNAQGETTRGTASNQVQTQSVGVNPPNHNASAFAIAGGNLSPNQRYAYTFTFTVTGGETLPGGTVVCFTSTTDLTAVIPMPGTNDPRVTGCKIYREISTVTALRLCATVSTPIPTVVNDAMSDATHATQPLAPTVDTSGTPYNRVPVSNIQTGPAGTTARRLYRRDLAGGGFRLVATIGDNTTTTYLDTKPTSALGAADPSSNTTGTAVQRIPVTNIPIGPSGVTARKLYRRFNVAGPFKLVTTLANNTTTSYTDAVANAALGANALATATAIGNQIKAKIPIGPPGALYREFFMSPVGDPIRRQIGGITDNVTTEITLATPDSIILTGFVEPTSDQSGLQQPSGQVNPGATALPVAYSGPFRPSGGWVVLGGGQVVKHTGISGNNLTGIPAAGSGAITTTVLYGQQVIPSPMLVGVSGLTRPMLKGSAVHLWIQRDDLAAQAEHAARTGGDGIVEYLIVDQRRGVDSLTDLCDADLARFSRPLLTVAYATRDVLTKSGKSVLVSLPSQRIPPTTLTIQDVTITEIDIAAGLAPRFTVRASSVRFSLEDTLRRLITGGQIVGGST